MAFLHGVETIEKTIGNRTVRVVRSGVIGLVGIAPSGDAQKMIYVQSESDIAQFGPQLPGFTIPQALAAIAAQGTISVVVINVYDSASHDVAVVDENVVLTGLVGKLAYAALSGLTVQNVGKSVTYVKDTDYTIDAYGNLRVISDEIASGATLVVNYNRLDPSAVGSADIIGTISGSNVRTGGKLYQEAFSKFGFTPRLFIAPGFSTIEAVKADLIVLANKYRGHAYIDAPEGTIPSVAIEGRGPAGTINFYTADKRAVLCYPMVKITNPDPGIADDDADKTYNFAFSAFVAGVQSNVDAVFGYWFSASNNEIQGTAGVERVLTSALNDPDTEANQLNKVGIVTQFNSFGSGLRVWGNRSAAWPTDTFPSNFISVQRTADIIHTSVELAMLPFVDKPLTSGLINSIKETVNNFIRTLIGRGAVLPGSRCFYDPAKNPVEQLALGQVVFDIEFMPPTPAERITFESFINQNLLASLA